MNNANQALTEAQQRKHHAESASSLQVKEWCNSFENNGETNDAAELGTAQHVATETRNFDGLDDEQVLRVQMVLDYLDAREAELRHRYPDLVVLREAAVQVDDVVWPTMGEKSTSGGYLDHAFVYNSGRDIEVNDYKFVRWPVEPAENNLQGMVYLLGLRRVYPQMERGTARFLMPYLDRIDQHTFSAADFPGMLCRVKRLVAGRVGARKFPHLASTNPSFSSCMWCGKIGTCAALRDITVKAAHKYAPLVIPEDFDPMKLSTKSDISRVVQFADVLKSYAEAARQRCCELVLDHPELEPETHTLVQTARREVADKAKFEAGLLNAGVTPEQIAAIKKIGITDAEKALKATQPRGMKDIYADQVMQGLQGEGVIQSGTPSIFLRAKKPVVAD